MYMLQKVSTEFMICLSFKLFCFSYKLIPYFHFFLSHFLILRIQHIEKVKKRENVRMPSLLLHNLLGY